METLSLTQSNRDSSHLDTLGLKVKGYQLKDYDSLCTFLACQHIRHSFSVLIQPKCAWIYLLSPQGRRFTSLDEYLNNSKSSPISSSRKGHFGHFDFHCFIVEWYQLFYNNVLTSVKYNAFLNSFMYILTGNRVSTT